VTLQAFTLNSHFRADEAVALLRPEYEALDDPTTEVEVSLALETARAHMLNQDHPPAVEITDVILAKAEATLPPAHVIDGIVTRATALGALRRPLESLALLRGAIVLADEHDLQAQAIRAFNNYRVVKSFDAPIVLLEEEEEFLARARRFGAAAWVIRSMGDSVNVAIAHGDLDGAEVTLDEMDSMEISEFERALTRFLRALIAAFREGSVEQLATAWELASAWDDTADAQLHGLAESLKGGVRLLEGDFAAAFGHALEDVSSGGVDVSMFCALALRDPERIERARAFAEEIGSGGRLAQASNMLADAGLAVASGDLAAAAGGFIEALELLKRIQNPFSVALHQALFSGLVGDAHPEATRAGQEARAWFQDAGMERVVLLISDWLPDQGEAASESA
jgi:hypothetical protein